MYKCKNPIVLIIFNRPECTKIIFERIKKVRPEKMYIISDGPRIENKLDFEKNLKCKKIVENIDWDCKIEKIYSEVNLGCKKRIITGLNYVFKKEEQVIILEDDCIPVDQFFKFCDWGLEKYKENKNIGIISGSNLLDYETTTKGNGFSMYINCWGWGTWKRTWEKFDEYLSIQNINKIGLDLFNGKKINKLQQKYWLNIFKHSIYSNTIWDFYLQYIFFSNNLYSVYPEYNLVENIGFSNESTHTKMKMKFVEKSKPNKDKYTNLLYSYKEEVVANEIRDEKIIKEIYGYSIISTYKLILGNILRYIGILK